MAQAMFDVACPCCDAILKIDPETRAVIAHTVPVKPPLIEDLAAEVAKLKGAGDRREQLFRSSLKPKSHTARCWRKSSTSFSSAPKRTPTQSRPHAISTCSRLKGHRSLREPPSQVLRTNQQVFRKTPFLVHPLLLQAEPGGVRHGFDLLQVELVAGFGTDGSPRREIHNQVRLAYADDLVDARAQVHFDALRLFVVADDVGKLAEIEITIEFAIDAAQKIQVEGGGDTGGIVVGIQQLRGGFHQVRAEQQ